MSSVSIEYCHECMYLERAVEIAQQVLNNYPIKLSSLELIPGKDGVFSVKLNDKLIYKINDDGPLPDVEHIEELLNRKLGH